MNFANLKSLEIPEGNVTKIAKKSDGTVLWKKVVELKNYFIPEQATLNVVMGTSTLETRAGFVWSNPISVNITKKTPFEIKVEGTKITEVNEPVQKIWLCSDTAGTVKTNAAILQYGIYESSNFGRLLADGTIHADYKAGKKIADSILNQIKVVRIGFKLSNSTITSINELKNVKITVPSDIGG